MVSLMLLLAGCGNSKDAQEATTEAPKDEIVIDYSAGLTDEGKLKGIKASDYVTLCDYDKLEIPKKEVNKVPEKKLIAIEG